MTGTTDSEHFNKEERGCSLNSEKTSAQPDRFLEARVALEFLRHYRATLPPDIKKAGIGAAIATIAEALAGHPDSSISAKSAQERDIK